MAKGLRNSWGQVGCECTIGFSQSETAAGSNPDVDASVSSQEPIFFWRIERLVFDFAIVAVVAAFQMFEGTGTSQKQRGPAPAAIGSTMTPQFTATDGYTVHVSGETAGTRLVGFNTPEKFSPQCANERQLGEWASARLKELVGGGRPG